MRPGGGKADSYSSMLGNNNGGEHSGGDDVPRKSIATIATATIAMATIAIAIAVATMCHYNDECPVGSTGTERVGRLLPLRRPRVSAGLVVAEVAVIVARTAWVIDIAVAHILYNELRYCCEHHDNDIHEYLHSAPCSGDSRKTSTGYSSLIMITTTSTIITKGPDFTILNTVSIQLRRTIRIPIALTIDCNKGIDDY